jgi:arylsulfatase A-like enzyme
MQLTLLSFLLTGFVFAAEKPMNVVIFLSDDLGVMDLNLDGKHPFYETPNLAKLANSGVRFSNGYSSCPVCSPTRSALMTGQNPARTGNTDFFGAPNEFFGEIPKDYDPTRDLRSKDPSGLKRPIWPAPYLGNLPKNTLTIADVMKQHGYATYFAGKWHLGPKDNLPTDHGFDINKGGTEKGGPYGGKKYFSPYENPHLEDGQDGEYLTERLGRETANFIRQNKDKPFFVYHSFYAVHTPLMAPKAVVKKYQTKREQLGLKDEFAPEPPRENRLNQSHAIYAAMLETMDAAVGHILDTLEEQGIAENTLVIFTSDNGGLSTSEGSPTSNLPYRAGKGWLYEGGIRVPLIVRHPKTKQAGKTCEEPVYTTDYFPTILAATGHDLRPEDHKDGVSFLTYLKNPAAAPSGRKLFWHYPHWGNQGGSPGTAIRDGKWKLIRWSWPARSELFDLEADPSESNDISTEHPDRAAEFEKEIDSFLRETQARSFSKNPNFSGKFEKW